MPPIRIDPKTSSIELTGRALRVARSFAALPRSALREARGALCLEPTLSWLWPRWILLRALGLVGVLAFFCWFRDVDAILGPYGLTPAEQLFSFENSSLLTILSHPTLLWLGGSSALLHAVALTGATASLALGLNLWPRAAALIAWLCYYSLIVVPSPFSAPVQIDGLIVELLLFSIFLAPAGFRPHLGAESPAGRLPIFAARVSVMKLMLVSGLCKYTSGDPNWRHFTAMGLLHETAPFPTVLGYYAHVLPHWFHVAETLLMMAAELVAPLLLVFGGPRAKTAALLVWLVFQAGIELTCNFGSLNLTAAAVVVALLDDGYLSWLSARFRIPAARVRPRVPGPARRWVTASILSLSLACSALATAGVLLPNGMALPGPLEPLRQVAGGLFLGNGVGLYRYISVTRFHILLEGSNDGGRTWREYVYRELPQALDRMSSIHAPLFHRFDTAMEIVDYLYATKAPQLLPVLGRKLLWARPEILSLFRENPFADRPPDRVRFGAYRYRLVDLETHRRTGLFWRREFVEEAYSEISIDRETGEFREGG